MPMNPHCSENQSLYDMESKWLQPSFPIKICVISFDTKQAYLASMTHPNCMLL